MKEKVFNLFLYVEGNIIQELGVACHDLEGNDESKLTFLQENVEKDFQQASRFPLPSIFKISIKGEEYRALNYDRYREMAHNGTDSVVFEEIFEVHGAASSPLLCITVINDGKVAIDRNESILSNPTEHPKKVHEIVQPSFIDEYINEEVFRLGDLINDDFFAGIKITFRNKLYVSSIKLMMSCIDTISYLEYGDVSGNFTKWLDSYVNLIPLGIKSEELWEFRNSILHMTNLDSRKILNSKVSRIQFYVSQEDVKHFKMSDEGKYFNYKTLISSIAKGIEQWSDSYNSDLQKRHSLIERYDRVISDKRLAYVSVE